jgi:hypothetical protein
MAFDQRQESVKERKRLGVLYIFQFPAMRGLRIVLVLQSG